MTNNRIWLGLGITLTLAILPGCSGFKIWGEDLTEEQQRIIAARKLKEEAFTASIAHLPEDQRRRLQAERRRQEVRDLGPQHSMLGIDLLVEERRPASLRWNDATVNIVDDHTIADVLLDSHIAISFQTPDRSPSGPSTDPRVDLLKRQLVALRKLPVNTKLERAAFALFSAIAADLVRQVGDELAENAEAVAKKTNQVEVTIEAYLTPEKGERRKIHVSEYDSIAGSATKEVKDHTVPDAMLLREGHRLIQAATTMANSVLSEPASNKTPLHSYATELLASAQDHKTLLRAPAYAKIPEGTIDLKKVKAKHNEQIELLVQLKKTTNGHTEIERRTFHMRAVQLGIYPVIRGSLIYARADAGPGTAQDWKPNAAASLEWRYRVYETDSYWKRALGWITPGFGVHVASLDMRDEESTELGIGVTASIWDGFLQAGIGYNLSVDRDHTYYYFGIDLLSVLDGVVDK